MEILKYPALTSLLFGCATDGLEDTPGQKDATEVVAPGGSAAGPADCSGVFDKSNLVPVDGSPKRIALYTELCDGGLYLVDTLTEKALLRINAETWLEEVTHAAMADEGSIRISASFITGIGPTGTIPFSVRYLVTETGGRWRSTELPREDSEPRWIKAGMVEITSEEQLQAVQLVNRSGPVNLKVDYTESRLVLKSVWLTSGSTKVTDVKVHRTDRAYFVNYETRSPPLGTTDMKHVVIFVVLPADDREVVFDDLERGATRIRAEHGVIEHATFESVGAP